MMGNPGAIGPEFGNVHRTRTHGRPNEQYHMASKPLSTTTTALLPRIEGRIQILRSLRVMIDADLAAALKVVKQREGVPESVQIRQALRAWLEKRGALRAERKRAITRKRP